MARFLEGRGMTEEALEIATDADYRFELAVQLGRLDTALQLAETSDSEGKWRQLGELALSSGKLQASFLSCAGLHSPCSTAQLQELVYPFMPPQSLLECTERICRSTSNAEGVKWDRTLAVCC